MFPLQVIVDSTTRPPLWAFSISGAQMFKSMIIYRIAESWQGDLQVLADALQKTVFAECGATQERLRAGCRRAASSMAR